MRIESSDIPISQTISTVSTNTLSNEACQSVI